MRTKIISWIGVLGLLVILGQVAGACHLRHDPDHHGDTGRRIIGDKVYADALQTQQQNHDESEPAIPRNKSHH